MKKLLSLLLSMTLVFSLVACSGGTTSSEGGNAEETPVSSSESSAESPASEEPSSPEAPEEVTEPTEEATESTEESGGTLVAYFSWSGNTEQMAQIIAEQTGGDLFEIEPANPYTDDYNTLLDIAQQEQADNARPDLASQVENWDDYDVVFVGYPNWWSDAPMAVYTFLESYDFSGKTLVPFNTSASGRFGRSLSGIEESASGATILEGLALTEGELSDAQGRITEWLNGLSLNG